MQGFHVRPRCWRWATLALAGLCVAPWAVVAQPDPFALDAPPGRVVAASYFGLHIHNLVLRGRVQDPPQATPWPGDQIGALRLWDSVVRWAEVEPSPGVFDFRRLDAYVQRATDAGVPVLYTLGSTPRWASARPDEPCSYGFGCAAEPADLADWERYVAAVARRYRGRIALYEVWNEPHPGQNFKETGFYNGSMATLVELGRRARAVLAVEDPAARLLSPGFVNRLGPFNDYLAAGGGAVVHGLAYHFYSGNDKQLVDVFRQVQATRERHALGGLPLYNTESGHDGFDEGVTPPPGHTARSRTQAAEQGARAWLLGAFMGLERWYHHGWDSGQTGMVRADLSATPVQGAWRRVRSWLVGAQPLQCRSLADNLVRCSLKAASGQRLWVLWRPAPGPALDWVPPADFQPAAAEYAVSGVPPGWKPGSRLRIGSDPLALWAAAPAATDNAKR